jgi:3-deoxy-manno-octulosonate cytidylyltransferase (CMP-KDO synthetase)
LTDETLPTGSDRAHAALGFVDPETAHDVIVILQGDLPTIDPATVRATLEPLSRHAECAIATLATEIENSTELQAPSVVKVALAIQPGDTIGRAVYFSRASFAQGPGNITTMSVCTPTDAKH